MTDKDRDKYSRMKKGCDTHGVTDVGMDKYTRTLKTKQCMEQGRQTSTHLDEDGVDILTERPGLGIGRLNAGQLNVCKLLHSPYGLLQVDTKHLQTPVLAKRMTLLHSLEALITERCNPCTQKEIGDLPKL